MPYGTPDGVAGRLPAGAPAGSFTAGSKPSLTTVTKWIAEISAVVDGKLRAAGFDPATIAGGGLLILTTHVEEYIAGMVERDWGSDDAPADGGDRKGPLLRLLVDLEEKPGVAALELGVTIPTDPATTQSSLRSYWTDSADRLDEVLNPDRTFKISGKF